jgi:hypothetical protein
MSSGPVLRAGFLSSQRVELGSSYIQEFVGEFMGNLGHDLRFADTGRSPDMKWDSLRNQGMNDLIYKLEGFIGSPSGRNSWKRSARFEHSLSYT